MHKALILIYKMKRILHDFEGRPNPKDILIKGDTYPRRQGWLFTYYSIEEQQQ